MKKGMFSRQFKSFAYADIKQELKKSGSESSNMSSPEMFEDHRKGLRQLVHGRVLIPEAN